MDHNLYELAKYICSLNNPIGTAQALVSMLAQTPNIISDKEEDGAA